MGRFLEITCPKEQAQYRRAGLLWVIDPSNPEDTYSVCGCTAFANPVAQEALMLDGWQYAILVEDDGGDD